MQTQPSKNFTLHIPLTSTEIKSPGDPLSPIEILIEKLSTVDHSKSKKIRRRNSRTHAELSNTAVGLREIAKKLGSTTLVWEAPPRTVLIVTKPHDTELITLTKNITLWLMSKGLSVLVEDKLKDEPAFEYQDLISKISTTNDSDDTLSDEEDYLSTSPSSTVSKNSESVDRIVSLNFWTQEYCSNKGSKEVDFVITLGGDGTVLYAAWLFQDTNGVRPKHINPPPIIPFNLGSLGFLTVFDFENFKKVIKEILTEEHKVRMNFRMRFQCKVVRHKNEQDDEETLKLKNDDGRIFHILNDLVVDRGPSPFMSQLLLSGNDKLLTIVQADGLVISTPTGSTAYSLSAGGSLVHPDVSAILVTPICPHTLSFRPMLLPDTMELQIKVPQSSRSTAFVSFDGRHRIQLFKGDSIIINASTSPIPTVCFGDQSEDWFLSLEKCLGWNKREQQKSMTWENKEIQYYEHKQYKKGLKTCEQILKKSPDHGETLAMKGLFLSHLEKRAEAHEFIRKGLKQDLTSHICWHVYGLLHRGEKNYEEAIKCYSHALKYDKENMHIIRDYSLLQVQMRNFEGYTDTRYQLLQLKPNNKLYWIGLAVAHHLNNDHASALHVLDTFETSLNELPVNYLDYEHSEMLLYKNLILEEMGDLKVALTHLERIKKNVLDLTSWKESKARILMKLKNFELASIIFSELFESNSDSLEYLKGLEECRGLNRGQPNENVNKVIAFYENLKNMYPKSHIVQSVPLFYTKEENFSNALSEYLKPSLLKGVPSLFVTLKDLYNEEWRIELIYQLLIKFYDNLVNIQKFEESEEELAAPTATLWTAYFIAQHFDYLRDSDKALEWIDVAIDHSPTLADACMIKAKILKHAGDKKSAAEAMNEARELDLQDRFINTKCTKYMLRNNEDLKAKETIGLFTKADVDTIEDLKEMQCMWYFIELGKCYSSQYNFEKSLKTFKFVDKVFVDIFDDQFDFHSYCLRKMTLTDYGKLLKTEDTIKKNKFFVKSSLGALNCYEKILDKKLGKDSNIFNGESDESKLSVSEQKKLARKQRKIEEKLLKEKFEQESKNKENTKTNREKTDEKKSNADTKKIEDDDPEGKKILELDIDIILKEAIKTFLEPLLEFSPSLIEGWCFGIEFYTRQEKYLLAWKCLKTGVKLSKFDPEIIKKSVKFLHHFYENFDNVNATVSEIFFSELMEIDPFELNLQDEAKNKELIKTTLDKLMSKLENFNTTLHQFVLLELHLELFNKDSQEAFINFQNYFKGKKVQTIRGWECKRFGWEAEFKLNEEKDDKIVLIGMDMAKKILTYIRNIKEFDDKNEILEFFKNFFVKFDALI